jgi:predicted dehydrogenase
MNMQKRREFIRKMTAGAAGLTIGSEISAMSARSYSRIMGANDRVNIAIIGLGRRLPAYVPAVSDKATNIELVYICDVMRSQREKALKTFSDLIGNKPKAENDIRKVLDDKNVDAIFNATPDHWHTPGACMAMKAGKHVYLEKPCSHNPYETELLLGFRKKYNTFVQMGNQYRSVPHFQEIIKEIHSGLIGTAYKGLSFLTSSRGEVPVPAKAPVPEGLDWDLFQGPAPRAEYTEPTWDYNWHWYGWTYGTAEAGNNAIHELDIARWALQVEHPEEVEVEAEKRHYVNDGWTMYDTMDATFRFNNKKIIKWDGKSRTNYQTYGTPRGTIIYGSTGTVYADPFLYRVYDLGGKLLREKKKVTGADDGTTLHMNNFFNTIRGKEKLNSPIEIGIVTNLLPNYANIAYRIGHSFKVDPATGQTSDRDAKKLWRREYEPGWEPKL